MRSPRSRAPRGPREYTHTSSIATDRLERREARLRGDGPSRTKLRWAVEDNEPRRTRKDALRDGPNPILVFV